MNTPLFDLAASRLAQLASLSETEARGTLRLTLKEAGLRPDLITPAKLLIVAERVLPRQLQSVGVSNGDAIGRELSHYIGQLPAIPATPASPADFLTRLRQTGR